jgi:hypothetical protein
MFEALGLFVEKLVRIKVGPVSLGDLPPGEVRPLSRVEVEALKRQVGLYSAVENSVIHRTHAKSARNKKGGSGRPPSDSRL